MPTDHYLNFCDHVLFVNSLGAAFQPGAKTVIPGKVIGKFSIRIVPNQEPAEVEKLVFDYINQKVINKNNIIYYNIYMYIIFYLCIVSVIYLKQCHNDFFNAILIY